MACAPPMNPFLIAVLVGASAADIYVAPHGSDANPGTSASLPVATLERARQLVNMGSTVHIGAGTYLVRQSVTLGVADSNVTWKCKNGLAVVSGGVTLDGPWKTYGNGILQYDVSVIRGRQSRHLWVNGQRAQRTRMSEGSASALLSGATMTDDGFRLRESVEFAPPEWPNDGRGVEFVYPQSTSPWTEPRCTVARANATFIAMTQPCWRNLVHKPCSQGAKGPPDLERDGDGQKVLPPSKWSTTSQLGAPVNGRGYVENVGPSSSMQPGEWALSADGFMLYYALRAGEAAGHNLTAEMPITNGPLLTLYGASHVRFENISFELATWVGASSDDGYVEQQSGEGVVGTFPGNRDCAHDPRWSVKLAPGAVTLVDTHNVSFVSCTFSRLGGAALDVSNSSSCLIDGCAVRDVSGNGLQLGQFVDPLGAHRDANHTVRDTLVEFAANEYHGGVAISVGYTVGLTIEHCEVRHLTYGGLSIGWGWSRHACYNCTNAGHNTIRANSVHDYKTALNDGGGIYMLGPQNGSLIEGNWVHDQHTVTSGALYPDEGSAYSTWTSNVVTGIRGSKWLHLWTGTIHDVLVADNFADTSVYLNKGTRCPMVNNSVFSPGKPPAAAKAIMDAAGVRPRRCRWCGWM